MHPTETEKAQHTAEPWTVEGGGSLSILSEQDNHIHVTEVMASGAPFSDQGPTIYNQDIAEANARRIVACVNACQGIPDPASALLALVGALERLLGHVEKHLSFGKYELEREIAKEAHSALAQAHPTRRK